MTLQSESPSTFTCPGPLEEMATRRPWPCLRPFSLQLPISEARCFAQDVEMGKRICWLTRSWFIHYIVLLCWHMDNRHVMGLFFNFANIFVDASCSCCCCHRRYCYFENDQSLPGYFAESHWLKSLAMQPRLWLDTGPASPLSDFVSLLLVNIKEKSNI